MSAGLLEILVEAKQPIKYLYIILQALLSHLEYHPRWVHVTEDNILKMLQVQDMSTYNQGQRIEHHRVHTPTMALFLCMRSIRQQCGCLEHTSCC